jgi:hypothetical protein
VIDESTEGFSDLFEGYTEAAFNLKGWSRVAVRNAIRVLQKGFDRHSSEAAVAPFGKDNYYIASLTNV